MRLAKELDKKKKTNIYFSYNLSLLMYYASMIVSLSMLLNETVDFS